MNRRQSTADGTYKRAIADVDALGCLPVCTVPKSIEAALRESRDLLEEAQAIAHVGSWTSGIGAADPIQWSKESYRIFGVPCDTPMTVESFFACVHPADRDAVRRASADATERGLPYDVEHRLGGIDGAVRWVRERAVVERDATGRATRLIGTVQDVAERHVATEALQASEERYRRIVENTSEGIWIYDVSGVTTFMNGRMAEMLGYTVEETIGQPIFAFMDASSGAAARELLELRRRGVAGRNDFRLRRKDGADLWISIQANPLLDGVGSFEAVLSLVTDVSAQRRADEARARLAAIVESSEDAIMSVDLGGLITSWNPGAQRLYQYSAEEVTGKHVSLLVLLENPDEEPGILERVARGEPVHYYETRRRRKDGTVVPVALTISPIRDAVGCVIGASGIVRDLTARRDAEAVLLRTEEQFRQAQKMDTVGRLAGGIAHDFNNLLSVILSYADLGVSDVAPTSPLRDDLEQIKLAGQRAAELTRQLLAFSRQQVLQPRVVDVNQIVVGMERMLRRLLGEGIELTVPAAGEVGLVLADPSQIEQVVMNLAVNARDAMPDGGNLTIAIGDIELDATYAGDHLGVAPGSYVLVAFRDTGTGMDAGTRARIFEPFFTTKEQGKGTGLGLSTVFGIVQQSGGHVEVDSEPGRGSTFNVYLPRTDATPSASRLPGANGAPRGSETILLVEDEEQVRTVACAILRRHGYHVLVGSNGEEASRVASGFASKIDLMLTDVVMPHMNGRRLAEQLAQQRPDMKVLFASGYADGAIMHHGVLDEGVAFLQKPFTPDVLLRKVRDVLDYRIPRGTPKK